MPSGFTARAQADSLYDTATGSSAQEQPKDGLYRCAETRGRAGSYQHRTGTISGRVTDERGVESRIPHCREENRHGCAHEIGRKPSPSPRCPSGAQLGARALDSILDRAHSGSLLTYGESGFRLTAAAAVAPCTPYIIGEGANPSFRFRLALLIPLEPDSGSKDVHSAEVPR